MPAAGLALTLLKKRLLQRASAVRRDKFIEQALSVSAKLR